MRTAFLTVMALIGFSAILGITFLFAGVWGILALIVLAVLTTVIGPQVRKI